MNETELKEGALNWISKLKASVKKELAVAINRESPEDKMAHLNKRYVFVEYVEELVRKEVRKEVVVELCGKMGKVG